MKTVLPCGREHQNPALEGTCLAAFSFSLCISFPELSFPSIVTDILSFK